MTEQVREYSTWENIEAANRAFTDYTHRAERQRGSPTANAEPDPLIARAQEDFEFFSSEVNIRDITSTAPFLLNAEVNKRKQRLHSIIPSPYTDEITGRGLDMPLRMAINFFALGEPGPHGLPLSPATPHQTNFLMHTITLLEYAQIANFREVMLLGTRRIRRIDGIGPVAIGRIVEYVAAIDSRLGVPESTQPGVAALLYDTVDTVPARVLSDEAVQKTRGLSVGDVLGMSLSRLTSTFGHHSGPIQDAAVAFESSFHECEERRIRVETESLRFISQKFSPPGAPQSGQ